MPTASELFLVEGKSAASTVRQAMDGLTQDVFALQGKLINVRSASQEKVEANAICAQLFAVLGCGIADRCDPAELRYSRIVLLTDPDVDGAHSRALLAILFARYLRPLVHNQRVFAVIPPLWKFVSPINRQERYAWTAQELEQFQNEAASAQTGMQVGKEIPGEVTRFRGVAQFSQAECSKLMLDPDTRRQVLLSL